MTAKDVSLVHAIIPIAVLIVLLSLSVYLFGSDSSSGPNQLALLVAGAVAAILAVRNGHPWAHVEKAIVHGISTALVAILILLSVGALIGTWILAGTVPAMIYYGLKLLNPHIFYAATAVICCVTSLSTGSSWTTAGTLGIGLMGVATGLGLSPAITAGAVISGAYFGDKMSPLSDTTNLAPAVVGTDVFTHVRHMVYTTTPSILIALVLFTIIGLRGGAEAASDQRIVETTQALAGTFNLNVFTLLPLLVVLFLAWRKFPALPTILGGAVLGGLLALVLQPNVVRAYADAPDLSPALALFKGVWRALADGYVSHTGHEAVDNLLTRGGMSSMLTTVWLIVCALSFGAVMEHAGFLTRLTRSALERAQSTGALVATVVFTCFGMNIVAADQYMSIVLPGKMYKAEFERRGLHPKNLSRALEDAGTLTSPLVPWNTCGAYMSATLGVATFAYLPFCFFNLINPFMSIFFAYRGITIHPADPVPAVSIADAVPATAEVAPDSAL